MKSSVQISLFLSAGLLSVVFAMQGCFGDFDQKKPARLVVDEPGANGVESDTEHVEEEKLKTLESIVEELPKGVNSFTLACQQSAAAGAVNPFTQAFCNGQTAPNNLQALFTGLGVQGGQTAININTGGLTAFSVTAMNPRVIIFPPNAENTPDAPFCVAAYARDEHGFVEAICRNQGTDQNASNNFSLYLFDYDLPCSQTEAGCSNGESFGPGAESGWAQLSVYESTSLENTVLDCKQCHQNGGPNARVNLRMPARANPWFGWCRDNRPSGIEVLGVIEAVHGSSPAYAGVAPNEFSNCDPAELEDLVIAVGNRNSDGNSTVNSNNLQDESSNETGGTFLPDSSNNPANAVYSQDLLSDINQAITNLTNENLNDGVSELFPHKTSVIAPVNTNALNNLTNQFNQFVAGAVADISHPKAVLSTEENVLRQAGKMIYPAGLSGESLFRRACAQCHNSALNQNITRARFNVDVGQMGPLRNEENDLAIERILLEDESVELMPPLFFAKLSPDEKQRLVNYLTTLKTP